MTSEESSSVVGDAPDSSKNASGKRKSFRQTLLKGSAWTVGGFALGQAVRLAGNIVLARLLYEEAFALMAITTAVMQGVAMFSDLGIGPSVVRNPRGDDPDFVNTAWTIQVVRAALLAALICLMAPPVTSFYASNDPMARDLLYLLPLIAASTLITGFYSPRQMLAARHLGLARLTAIELTQQVTGIAVMIFGAWKYHSVYALAVGAIAATFTQCVLSHTILRGHRAHFRWDRSTVREIVHFGKWIFLSTAITFFAVQLDKLAFASMFPLDVVGVYGIAASLAVLVPTLTQHLQSRVAFPLYSRTQQSGAPLPPVVERTKYPILTFGGFIVAACIACGPTFIDVAYDDRYAAAATYIPILAVGGWFATVHGTYSVALLASGDARSIAFSQLAKVTAFCALVFPTAKYFGIVGAVVALTAADLVKTVSIIAFARKIQLRKQKLDLLFTAYVGTVGFGVLWVTSHVHIFSTVPMSALLLLEAVIVALLFLPLFVLAKRKLLLSSSPQASAQVV